MFPSFQGSIGYSSERRSQGLGKRLAIQFHYSIMPISLVPKVPSPISTILSQLALHLFGFVCHHIFNQVRL